MAEIVNLRRVKKAKARQEKGDEAATNRTRFGQPKDSRNLTKALVEKRDRDLDAARLDPDKPLKK